MLFDAMGSNAFADIVWYASEPPMREHELQTWLSVQSMLVAQEKAEQATVRAREERAARRDAETKLARLHARLIAAGIDPDE